MADQEEPPQGPPAPPPSGGNLPLGGGGGNGNLVPTNIEDEMKRSYLDYAMSVIVGRALPDIRDGLKPVHRRILYTMQQMGLQPNRPTRKCARIVGDAMGKYHPHGNLAIYDALVRLAQPFSMRYPLVEGQGNFGSVDGDPPAADRYTEARLARVATALLEDLDKETVDFKPNYDDSETEPEVLPTRVPNLLVNGSSGIAVGMATNIPPHNLTEIVDAVIHKIQHPDAGLAKMLEFVQGPDFPTGGFILGRQGILQAYTTGRGQLKIRARAKIERVGKEKDQIIIDEIPYQVNKSKLLEQIASMVNEKRIEGISDVLDHSDRDGMRIVVELKRGEQAEVVLNNLYKNTQLQIGFGIIMLSIVNGQPRELGLVDMIKFFIDHRVEVVRRRTEYELRKAREREHILLGFQKALDNLDEVIRLIRAAKQPREAREALIARFQFSEKQAQAIIELQLQRLTGMEQQKILDELAEIQRRIAEYLEILGSDKVLRDLIVKELKEVQKDFGDERRTQIIEDTGEILLEDLVAVEDVAITVTRGGYLKRTSVDTYRRQTRGGKGRIGMGTRAEDVVEHLLVTSTHSYLLIFTTRGRVYWLKAYEIPDATTTGKGKHISNLINLQSDEEPRTFLPVKDFVPDRFVVMVTKQRGHQEVGADGVRQSDCARPDRADAGRGRPTDRRRHHQRVQLHFPGIARRPGDPLRREPGASHGPAGARRARHGSGRGRLPGRRGGGREGRPHPLVGRERLRQAHPARRIPVDQPRRQGRHQHEDHQEDRQRGGNSFGARGFRYRDRQPERQDHPHRSQHHPAGRPVVAGCAAGVAGRRRPGGRCLGGSRYRKRQRAGAPSAPVE